MPDLDIQLANPAWYALTGAQADCGEPAVVDNARRYQSDVAYFAAIRCFGDAASWADLATMVGPGRVATVGRGDAPPEAPADWEPLFSETTMQYLCVDPAPLPDIDVVDLGGADAPEMVELVKLTEPGPFLDRTWILGHYIGIRRDGELVAMAGERMRADDWSEISAVCVHPSARRQGLGAALTTMLAHEIRGRGAAAILHVRPGNDGGHALYQSIGFEQRSEMTFRAWRTPT